MAWEDKDTLRSVALANQKGGVGKTTSAIHLAHGLALTGRSVAILDLDPQGNATLALEGMAAEPPQVTRPPLDLMRLVAPDMWLLPSPGAERSLPADVRLDADRLRGLVEALRKQGLAWLLVDCPPRMDHWGWTGVSLCEEVLVPVQAEFFAMHGLGQMQETLHEIRRQHPRSGSLLGVLPTMVDLREPVTAEILADLREHLGTQLLDTPIYRDAAFVEAASHGKTVFEYDLSCKGARSYGELVREVLYGRSTTG